MGRYSSVQAYADNNANMRSIPYDQAVGAAQSKEGPGRADDSVVVCCKLYAVQFR